MKLSLLFIAAFFYCVGLFGQPTLQMVPLRGEVYLIKHASIFQGNVVVLKDKAGGLIVDVQSVPNQPPLIDSMKLWNLFPIKFAVNTHWHFDHTKGNKAFKENGTYVISHPNAYTRMKTGQTIEHFKTAVEPYSKNELPDTLVDRTTSFIIGKERVIIHSPGAAHTDGDLIVQFVNANVIHAGDILLSSFYPFPELSSGGSVDGLIKAIEFIIEKSNQETIIIPGHGAIMSLNDVVSYKDMLTDVSKKVTAALHQKKTLKEIQDMDLTKPYAAKWNSAAISGSQFVEMIYKYYVDIKR